MENDLGAFRKSTVRTTGGAGRELYDRAWRAVGVRDMGADQRDEGLGGILLARAATCAVASVTADDSAGAAERMAEAGVSGLGMAATDAGLPDTWLEGRCVVMQKILR